MPRKNKLAVPGACAMNSCDSVLLHFVCFDLSLVKHAPLSHWSAHSRVYKRAAATNTFLFCLVREGEDQKEKKKKKKNGGQRTNRNGRNKQQMRAFWSPEAHGITFFCLCPLSDRARTRLTKKKHKREFPLFPSPRSQTSETLADGCCSPEW